MSITYLELGGETSCATGEVTVRALADRGLDGFRFELTADGAPFDGPSIVRPGRVVLPVLTGRIEIAVTTETGDAVFGPDARVRLLVDVVTSDGGFDQVRSPEVDLSGLHGTPVLWLDATRAGLLTVGSTAASASPRSGRLVKAAPVPSQPPVPASVADPIAESPLVRLARTESRVRVNAVKAPDEELRGFTVVLDRSASMMPHYRSGAIAGVLSALVGLSHVFGTDVGLAVWSGGLAARNYSADLAHEPLADLLAKVYQLPDSGFALAPVIGRLPGSGSRTVFVITDDCPPDLPELTEHDLSGADSQRLCHLVVFGRSRYDFRTIGLAEPAPPERFTDDPMLNPRQNLLFTSVAAAEPESIADSLTRSQDMRAMVAALVRGSTK
jgi:hypothetical protein